MGATATLGWQFVHISDPKTARDPATRRFVRATVAANYHRKERQHHSLAHVTDEDDTAKAGKNKQRKKKQKLSLRIAGFEEARVDECSSPPPQALSVPGQVEPTDNADEDNYGSKKPPPSVSSLRSLTNALTTGHNDPWGVRFTGVEYQPDYGSLLQYCRRPCTPYLHSQACIKCCCAITNVLCGAFNNHDYLKGLHCVRGGHRGCGLNTHRTSGYCNFPTRASLVSNHEKSLEICANLFDLQLYSLSTPSIVPSGPITVEKTWDIQSLLSKAWQMLLFINQFCSLLLRIEITLRAERLVVPP